MIQSREQVIREYEAMEREWDYREWLRSNLTRALERGERLDNKRNILFAALPFPLDPQAHHPLLMESHGNNLQMLNFFTITRRVDNFQIYEFYKKEVSPVSPVSDGWISLVDFKDRRFGGDGAPCCLLNTVTKQKIQMPPIKYKGSERGVKYYDCVLSKPTADPECRYIFFSASDLHWCCAGDAQFQKARHSASTDYINTLINFKGTVYGLLGERRDIVEVKFSGPEMSFSSLINDQGQHCNIPNQASTGFMEADGYFIDCCGDLLFAQMLLKVDDRSVSPPKFEVFKVDTVRKECSKVNTIGERAVFVPGGMAVDCEEEVPGVMKDTIYFLWLECMWSYNVAQRKITGRYRMPGSHLSWLII
ncbi:hypothetical protein ACS0TY_034159 [Phlomoides rotata]